MNRFVVIEGKRYVMKDGVLVKLYWGKYKKDKKYIGGYKRDLAIKSICQYCEKEFLHPLYNPGVYCSKSCTSKSHWKTTSKSMSDIRESKRIIIPSQFNSKLKGLAQQRISILINGKYIIRPKYCTYCSSGGRIEAHHFNYYRPYEVIWLCALCHRRIHYGYDVKGEISNYNDVALEMWGNDIIEIALVG